MPRDRREYNARRHRERMDRCIAHLGGECVRCGTTEQLEIDHVDPATKSFTIGSGYKSWERVLPELAKCQLLCKQHHLEKSIAEATLKHGTAVYGSKKCKCDECKAIRAQYYRDWYAKNGRKKVRLAD